MVNFGLVIGGYHNEHHNYYGKLQYVRFPDGGLEGLLKRERPVDVSKDKNVFLVKRFSPSDKILSVFANNNLYVGLRSDDNCSKNLYVLRENGWESLAIRHVDGSLVSIEDIAQLGPEFGCKVVVGGIPEALFDVNGERLIHFKKFRDRDILGVEGIVGGDDKHIFLLIEDDNFEKKIVRAIYEDGKFRLGEEVLHYNTETIHLCRSRFLGKDKDGSPLVISTVPLKYLVINNEKVKKSNVVSDDAGWTRLVVINNDFKNELVDVLVSGFDVGGVVYMKINYGNSKVPVVEGRRYVITNFSDDIYSLGVVRSKKLHEMLMSLKGKG